MKEQINPKKLQIPKETIKPVHKNLFTFLLENRAVALLIILGVYAVIFSLIYPKTFATPSNFLNILLNMSGEGFIVVAMVMLLICGEIDLSLGSNMVLAGIVCGYMIKFGGGNIFIAVLVTLAVSLSMGLLNGIIVAKIGVNSLLTTLATSLIFQGIAVWLAGPGLTDFPEYFQEFGQFSVFGFRLPIVFTIATIIIFSYLTLNTKYFRQFYFIGGNVKAAILSGINIKKTKVSVFVVASLLASFSGVIAAARFNSAMTSVGGGVELRAITAAIIGGISFTGGVGTMIGAAVGALFIATLNNGLVISGVNPYLQNVVIGVVLVLAIVVDVLISKRKKV